MSNMETSSFSNTSSSRHYQHQHPQASNGTTSIENYDVLTELPRNGTYGRYQLDEYSHHVGNKRLKVFLDLKQAAYDDARQRGDTAGLDKIVENIVNTVCQQCVPPGRFLCNLNQAQSTLISGSSAPLSPSHLAASTDPIWQPMQPKQVQALIHAVLQPRTEQQPLTHTQPEPSINHNIISIDQSTSDHMEGWTNGVSLKGDLLVEMLSSKSTQQLSPVQPEDASKRRRRSSLLRRSASESMLIDSKKKVFRMGALDTHRRQVKEEPTWLSSSHTNQQGLIVTLNRRDVVLTSSRTALDPNSQSPGNNRLHILVFMQSGKYQQATIDERESILDEVIETVNTFWKGRFLAASDEGYEILNQEDARNALRSIFDMRSSQSLFSSHQNNGNDAVIISDHNLIPASVNSAQTPLVPSVGPGLISRSPRIGLLKQSSMGALPQPPTMVARQSSAALARHVSASVLPSESTTNMGDVCDLREAAVRSLQKQKQRQAIANRIGKVSASARTQRFTDWNPVSEFPPIVAPPTTFASSAKERRSTVFGKLDPSLLAELDAVDIDDEDSKDN